MPASMLHVVNGDSTAEAIRASGVLRPLDPFLNSSRDPDDVVAWKDVLYEGPVRPGLSPVNLAHERCQFIASRGWEPYITARQAFGRRDTAIATTKRHDEVIFWFESDPYDCLQLVQALDRLAARRPRDTAFSWILVDQRPDAPGTHGFGHLTADAVQRFLASRQPVPESAWMDARRVWTSFISGDPARVQVAADDSALTIPFLRDAFMRLLAEYPEQPSGLSQSEREVLRSIADGFSMPNDIFQRVQSVEQRPFLGDRQVWDRLESFGTSTPPLIERADGLGWVSPVVDLLSLDEPDMDEFHAQVLRLTEAGVDVLAGRADWLEIRPGDRWLGGYQIPASGSWRFDAATGRLVSASNSTVTEGIE